MPSKLVFGDEKLYLYKPRDEIVTMYTKSWQFCSLRDELTLRNVTYGSVRKITLHIYSDTF